MGRIATLPGPCSYPWADRDAVEQLAQALRNHDLRVLIDTRMDGIQGARIWCGYGVLAHNLVKIGGLLEATYSKAA
jgi:hypothetical protein